MKRNIVIGTGSALLTLLALLPLILSGAPTPNMAMELEFVLAKQGRMQQLPAKWDALSVWHTAPLEVAKVFGRAQGCTDADTELIEMTARAAIEADLEPAIAAATVATESACNQYAVSGRGAIGLMQIMPRIWKDRFDFAGNVNLFNKRDNIQAGAMILASLIDHYGTQSGIQRYNGAGVGCDSCDGGYAVRILALAHKPN